MHIYPLIIRILYYKKMDFVFIFWTLSPEASLTWVLKLRHPLMNIQPPTLNHNKPNKPTIYFNSVTDTTTKHYEDEVKTYILRLEKLHVYQFIMFLFCNKIRWHVDYDAGNSKCGYGSWTSRRTIRKEKNLHSTLHSLV